MTGRDIVERLATAPYMTSALRREAAEEIERLRAERDELRALMAEAQMGDADYQLAFVQRDRLLTACDEANDLLESARPAENLEGASEDDWYDARDAWRKRNEYDKE